MQFDTTINKWHTSKNTARINASNPCSEYMFLDNSACNLASFNLMKFVTPTGVLQHSRAYRHAISVVITAMEILVDNSGYPDRDRSRATRTTTVRLASATPTSARCSCRSALPYDSDDRPRSRRRAHRHHVRTGVPAVSRARRQLPRRFASATPLTASVERQGGACPGFYVNREPFLDVIRMHRAEVNNIGKSRTSGEPFMRSATRRAHRLQPRVLGYGAASTASATAIATRRPPCWLPPAPSAS